MASNSRVAEFRIGNQFGSEFDSIGDHRNRFLGRKIGLHKAHDEKLWEQKNPTDNLFLMRFSEQRFRWNASPNLLRNELHAGANTGKQCSDWWRNARRWYEMLWRKYLAPIRDDICNISVGACAFIFSSDLMHSLQMTFSTWEHIFMPINLDIFRRCAHVSHSGHALRPFLKWSVLSRAQQMFFDSRVAIKRLRLIMNRFWAV